MRWIKWVPPRKSELTSLKIIPRQLHLEHDKNFHVNNIYVSNLLNVKKKKTKRSAANSEEPSCCLFHLDISVNASNFKLLSICNPVKSLAMRWNFLEQVPLWCYFMENSPKPLWSYYWIIKELYWGKRNE